jgi:hypothetical protein
MDSIRQLDEDCVPFFANDVVIAITKTSRRINENILSWSDIPNKSVNPAAAVLRCDTLEQVLLLKWFVCIVRTSFYFRSGCAFHSLLRMLFMVRST